MPVIESPEQLLQVDERLAYESGVMAVAEWKTGGHDVRDYNVLRWATIHFRDKLQRIDPFLRGGLLDAFARGWQSATHTRVEAHDETTDDGYVLRKYYLGAPRSGLWSRMKGWFSRNG